MTVIVTDLLGIPFASMPCRDVVLEVLRRMGRTVPDDAFEGRPELWCRAVGNPADGDVILSRQSGQLHAVVVVDALRGRCLTSDYWGGVRLVSMSRALPDCEGVYRLR